MKNEAGIQLIPDLIWFKLILVELHPTINF